MLPDERRWLVSLLSSRTLAPGGGYPGNDDDGRALQKSLDGDKLRQDFVNSAHFLKSHELSTGKIGATGFCWGGSTTNFLAITLGDQLQAAVPLYGSAPETSKVPNIRAAVMVQYAEKDGWGNKTRANYEAALQAADVTYEMHSYPGTGHGFHNYSTARYNEEVAKLAWERTIAWFTKYLS